MQIAWDDAVERILTERWRTVLVLGAVDVGKSHSATCLPIRCCRPGAASRCSIPISARRSSAPRPQSRSAIPISASPAVARPRLFCILSAAPMPPIGWLTSWAIEAVISPRSITLFTRSRSAWACCRASEASMCSVKSRAIASAASTPSEPGRRGE